MFKNCNTCKTDKMLSEFRKDSSQKDGYQHRCKQCARVYHQSVYNATQSQKARTRNASRREIGKALIDEARSCGCSMCEEDDLVCLEFHHIDPNVKEFQVGGYGINFSLDRLRAEIAKCIVVCANCHKKIHAGKIILASDGSRVLP